ncbi:MAG: hypothetical protein ACLR0U_30050 [Enterocloster clostridioformis]
MWLEEVRRLLDGGIRRQYADIEIQYLFISQGCLCGVPNEAMCRIAVDIWKEAEAPLLFFNGYTNGCSSYLPTAEEYDKGRIRGAVGPTWYIFPYHGRVMPLNRDTAGKNGDAGVCGIGRRGIINHHKIIIRAMSASRRQGLSASGHTPAADSPCNGLYDSIVFLHPV